jgi:glycosyltransferase involved in cell wall biosynthesis
MTELRVLHMNTEPTWRGGEQQSLYLMDGLAKREVFSILAAQPGGPMAERARANGHTVIEQRMRGEADALAILALSRLMRREKISVVHCHTSHAHTLGAVAATLIRRSRRPKVVVSRRVDFSIFRRSFFGLNHIKYLHGVDRYVTVSHAIRDVLIKDGIPGERITTVHSGIDLARITEAPDRTNELREELQVPADDVLVGNVAHLADHKGQRYLLDAVPRILTGAPNTTFAIVGKGELREDLEAQARELGIADRVRFTGFRTDVPSLLKAFDLFVMPSHMEGLGTSVLDAMAAGTPVVGTEAGGMPEAIEHQKSGLVVPIKDPAALAQAVLHMLKNPQQAGHMAANALERVKERFSTDSMVEGTLAVYRDLLESVTEAQASA